MRTSRNSQALYEGYCIDLMEKLFSKVDSLPYEIRVVKDSKYGSRGKDGEWDGMIGEILRGVSGFRGILDCRFQKHLEILKIETKVRTYNVSNRSKHFFKAMLVVIAPKADSHY